MFFEFCLAVVRTGKIIWTCFRKIETTRSLHHRHRLTVKRILFKGEERGCGRVVKMHAFYYNDSSLNPVEVYRFIL